MKITTSVLVVLTASMSWSCAQTSSLHKQTAYVPRGQAAQPGWGNAQEWSDASGQPSATPRGRAAQPGGWHPGDDDGRYIVANTGVPAGQAAQPGWHQDPAGWTSTSRAAAEDDVTPPRTGEAWPDTAHYIHW